MEGVKMNSEDKKEKCGTCNAKECDCSNCEQECKCGDCVCKDCNCDHCKSDCTCIN